MTIEHVSLPVRLPDLAHLTDDELQALRRKIASMTRDARKKATSVIGRIPSVQKPWMKSLGLKTDDPARQEILSTLELELLRHPDAFLAYAYVNSLFVLDEGLKAEGVRRMGLPGKKYKPTPLPTQAPEVDVIEHVGCDVVLLELGLQGPDLERHPPRLAIDQCDPGDRGRRGLGFATTREGASSTFRLMAFLRSGTPPGFTMPRPSSALRNMIWVKIAC